MRTVIELRNSLIEFQRSWLDCHAELDQVNALLSLGHGAKYPLVGFHRDRVERMRDGLSRLGNIVQA